jgi:tripartite-type tricarboxylate transporter receptor subunit TctC
MRITLYPLPITGNRSPALPAFLALPAALAAALALPDTRQRLADQGINPGAMTAEQFAAFIRSERTKWAKVVKEVGIEPQ